MPKDKNLFNLLIFLEIVFLWQSLKYVPQIREVEKIVSVSAAKAEYFWLQNKLEEIADELRYLSTKGVVNKINTPELM